MYQAAASDNFSIFSRISCLTCLLLFGSSCFHFNCMEINVHTIFLSSILYSSPLFTHRSFWCSCLFKSNLQLFTVKHNETNKKICETRQRAMCVERCKATDKRDKLKRHKTLNKQPANWKMLNIKVYTSRIQCTLNVLKNLHHRPKFSEKLRA